ncbi:MAG: tetratricopeptide repeat protein [Limisphaerales bacterium]
MKRIFSVCIFLLMLGIAAAQQSTNNSSVVTNDTNSPDKEIMAKALRGSATAQCALGEFYYFKSDSTVGEALKWFRKAANQGNAQAEYYLGRCYENGYGVLFV